MHTQLCKIPYKVILLTGCSYVLCTMVCKSLVSKRTVVSNSIYAKTDRNGPPSANQVASKDEPRCNHAVYTLQVHPPTSPCPALSAAAEPKSQGHCRKRHHEAETLMTLMLLWALKGFINTYTIAENNSNINSKLKCKYQVICMVEISIQCY